MRGKREKISIAKAVKVNLPRSRNLRVRAAASKYGGGEKVEGSSGNLHNIGAQNGHELPKPGEPFRSPPTARLSIG